MENRYDGILQTHNQDIIQLAPSNGALRLIMAHEFKRLYKPGMRVLEIGCGDGDSAEPLLRLTDAPLVLLDVSPEMIDLCRVNLAKYANRVTYVCEDALAHLERGEKYDIVMSSWTIHNFPWDDKVLLFMAIYDCLPPDGVFILMDKIPPIQRAKELLEVQCRRYQYLPQEIKQAIIEHERFDDTDDYRMDEHQVSLHLMWDVHFNDLTIVDRVERDIVLVATK